MDAFGQVRKKRQSVLGRGLSKCVPLPPTINWGTTCPPSGCKSASKTRTLGRRRLDYEGAAGTSSTLSSSTGKDQHPSASISFRSRLYGEGVSNETGSLSKKSSRNTSSQQVCGSSLLKPKMPASSSTNSPAVSVSKIRSNIAVKTARKACIPKPGFSKLDTQKPCAPECDGLQERESLIFSDEALRKGILMEVNQGVTSINQKLTAVNELSEKLASVNENLEKLVLVTSSNGEKFASVDEKLSKVIENLVILTEVCSFNTKFLSENETHCKKTPVEDVKEVASQDVNGSSETVLCESDPLMDKGTNSCLDGETSLLPKSRQSMAVYNDIRSDISFLKTPVKNCANLKVAETPHTHLSRCVQNQLQDLFDSDHSK